MDTQQIIQFLEEFLRVRLDLSLWSIKIEDDQVSLLNRFDANVGFSLSLPVLSSKLKDGKEEEILADAAIRLAQMANASQMKKDLRANQDAIYPVLRSRSHPLEKKGIKYIHSEHTAESQVFYALDLGNTYVLIDERMVAESGFEEQEIKQLANVNLKKLDTSYKEDEVAGNKFYFFSGRDGYAASRILNDELISFMKRKIEKEIGLSIPHQDVLIIADIRNDIGYKVLAKLTMDFCVKGDIPISALPFLLTESGDLEPIMIMSNPGAAPTIRKK